MSIFICALYYVILWKDVQHEFFYALGIIPTYDLIIAEVAQQPTYFACLVVVVNAHTSVLILRRLLAYRAFPMLCVKHPTVFFDSDSILRFEVTVTLFTRH